jgi:hypothetical protein
LVDGGALRGGKSISIFGIRPTYKPTTEIVFERNGPTVEKSDPFGMLCESTGGLALDSKNSNRMMSKQIQRVVTMLRDRYILEFPRPANGLAGSHSFDVKINDPTAIIRPAGVAFPPRMSDPKQPDGTVPQDPSRMPLVGSKNAENQPE